MNLSPPRCDLSIVRAVTDRDRSRGGREILKQLAQRIALRTGLCATRGASRRQQRAPAGSVEIFFGHHVSADTAPGGLTETDLHDRLRYLQRTRDVVSLPEAVQWLGAGYHPAPGPNSRPLRLAVITFDDGYQDNLAHLLPVLQATKTPATVFVATQPVVEGGYLWFDQARSAVQQATEDELAAMGLDWTAGFPAGNARQAIVDHLKRSAPAQRQKHLAELLAALPTAQPTAEQRMMTTAELREFAADPLITIGAHTHSHQILSCCDAGQATEELAHNLRTVQEITGVKPTLFAYPNGRSGDFNPATAEVLRAHGIAGAVTTLPGLNPPGSQLLELGRLPLGEGPVARFAWQVDCRSA